MRFARILVCTLFALQATPAWSADNQFNIKIANHLVTVWLPKDQANAPVLLYSHGFHACADSADFLMDRLALNGYAIFAPNHADAACNNLYKSRQDPVIPFEQPEKWTDQTYADRKQDIKDLLDALPKEERFKNLDWTHVGMIGYSLGGYTALGLAGAWPSWKDTRISAVLALSPYSQPFLSGTNLERLGVPVMYQGGTEDNFMTPAITRAGGAYELTSRSKYYVEFRGARHSTWSDAMSGTYQNIIGQYANAFFDTELKRATFPEGLKQAKGVVTDWRAEE